jgi:hypothetical protein
MIGVQSEASTNLTPVSEPSHHPRHGKQDREEIQWEACKYMSKVVGGY